MVIGRCLTRVPFGLDIDFDCRVCMVCACVRVRVRVCTGLPGRPRRKPPTDSHNTPYVEYLNTKHMAGPADFLEANKDTVAKMSEQSGYPARFMLQQSMPMSMPTSSRPKMQMLMKCQSARARVHAPADANAKRLAMRTKRSTHFVDLTIRVRAGMAGSRISANSRRPPTGCRERSTCTARSR